MHSDSSINTSTNRLVCTQIESTNNSRRLLCRDRLVSPSVKCGEGPTVFQHSNTCTGIQSFEEFSLGLKNSRTAEISDDLLTGLTCGGVTC